MSRWDAPPRSPFGGEGEIPRLGVTELFHLLYRTAASRV